MAVTALALIMVLIFLAEKKNALTVHCRYHEATCGTEIAGCYRSNSMMLELMGRKLAFISPQVGYLPALQMLYMYNNDLAVLPDEISCLHNLEDLQVLFSRPHTHAMRPHSTRTRPSTCHLCLLLFSTHTSPVACVPRRF